MLTGDGALRALAGNENVECQGVLWVMDQLEETRIMRPRDLGAALSGMAARKRFRIDPRLVNERLARYARDLLED